jgi:hypothetical protein
MQADKASDCPVVSSFAVAAVAAVKYTLAVILHIPRVDRDDKGTGYTDGSLTVPSCNGMQADKACDFSVARVLQ